MSKGNIFSFSVLLLAGASGAALAQQGANGPAASVPAPSGGPVGSPTATPGATSGVKGAVVREDPVELRLDPQIRTAPVPRQA